MISSATGKVAYTLSSATQTLAVAFYFLESSHLKVLLTPAGTSIPIVLVLTTHYTVSGAGNEAGGSITLTGAAAFGYTPASGDKVTITRSVPATQLVDYVAGADFPAATQERALDKLTMLVQQLVAGSTLGLRFEEAETLDGVLTLVSRKGKSMKFNATTGAVEFFDVQDVLDAADEATASAAAAAVSAEDAEDAANALLADLPTAAQLLGAGWGDSLTAGTGSTAATNGWPGALQLRVAMPFYNGGVGGETSTQIRTRMVAATTRHQNFTIIWAGRNNFSDPTTVKADIAAMVAVLGHTRYLVLGVLNQNTAIAGTSEHTTIVALNADLATIYGERFVDMRDYLINDALADLGITPTAQDLLDIGNDVPPDSLRSDNIHLNDNGYIAVALKIYTVWNDVLTFAKYVGTLLASFGDIGGISAGNVRASALFIGTKKLYPAGNGNPQLAADFYPAASDTYNLGLPTLRWNDGSFGGTVFIGAAGTKYWKAAGTGDLQTNSLLLPASDKTQNLGSTTLFWNTIYGATLVLRPTTTNLALSIRTSPSSTSGGGAIVESSAGSEKWRFGLRNMITGTEGDDFIFGYYDGTNRFNRIKLLAAGGLQINATAYRNGSGSPEGVVVGSVGDIYTSTSGGAGTTLYVKESGNSTNTGWIAK